MAIHIIAEAGVNHNGSEELAFKLVDAAVAAGVDVVKFQTFKASGVVTKTAQQCEYQSTNMRQRISQFEMLQRLELSYNAHYRLLAHCQSSGIEFLSTAFDSQSLDFLINEMGLKTLKVPSGELTNAPFLLQHAQTGCRLILSTGMATLSEIEDALGVVAFGLCASTRDKPSRGAFREAYCSAEGQKSLNEKVTLLHCTSEYPAPVEDINLNVLATMCASFGLPVGYSDHSEGIAIPTAAAALGASIIEKHFTLDKEMDGPDHKASLNPQELTNMVCAVRDVEQALGSGRKIPSSAERKNGSQVRKSLIAACPISKGDIFTEKNLTTKRPGDGLSPYVYWELLGKKVTRDYDVDEVVLD